nr:radical SAM protein [Rhizobium sp. BK376]
MTSACQLRCDYCSAVPFSGRHLPLTRTLELIAELGQLGVFSLLLSGGEPTIHRGFIELAKMAAASVPEVMINSNGIRLARLDYAKRLHEVAPASLVAISLDSADTKTNDQHRGAGGISAVNAIENLVSLGHAVCISTVMTGDNFKSAESLIDRFFPDVRVFRFFPRIPRSVAEANDDEYWTELSIFFERVQQRAGTQPWLKPILPYKSVQRSEQGLMFDTLEHCCCAFSKAFIDSSLQVYPCYYSANTDTRYGDLLQDSFKAIWSGERARETREASRLRSLCSVSLLRPHVPHKFHSQDWAHGLT